MLGSAISETSPLKTKLFKVLCHIGILNYFTKSCPTFECIIWPVFYKTVWMENKMWPLSEMFCVQQLSWNKPRLPDAQKSCTKHHCSYPKEVSPQKPLLENYNFFRTRRCNIHSKPSAIPCICTGSVFRSHWIVRPSWIRANSCNFAPGASGVG